MRKARRMMSVAYASGLHRAVELTLVGDDWQVVRNRVKRLTHRLAQVNGRAPLVWCVEENPAGTGHHVHGLTGGAWYHQRVWNAHADAVGLGERCWVRRARTSGAGHYAVKAGLYAVKGVAGTTDDYARVLRINGGRIVHTSRRAFNGRTWPEAWKWYCGIKGWNTDPGPWRRERRWRGTTSSGMVVPTSVG